MGNSSVLQALLGFRPKDCKPFGTRNLHAVARKQSHQILWKITKYVQKLMNKFGLFITNRDEVIGSYGQPRNCSARHVKAAANFCKHLVAVAAPLDRLAPLANDGSCKTSTFCNLARF